MKASSILAMAVTGLGAFSVLAENQQAGSAPPAVAAPAESPAAAVDESVPSTQPSASMAKPAEVYVGRVSGDSVYIRSGPSTNYYPVTKLNRGQLVRVAGGEHGWLRISPPKGCFSLVDKTFVDKGADGKGVVNGDAVWVRTGSLIPEHARKKYAKQVKVDRGAILTLVDETEDDGFYKVLPPQDAHVWMSESFVEKVADAPAFVWKDGAWVSPIGDTMVAAGEGKGPATRPAAKSVEEARRELAASIGPGATRGGKAARPPTTQPDRKDVVDEKAEAVSQKQLAEIEQELEVELKKPLVERKLERFIKRLQPIARQPGESVSKIYAQQRIQQLKDQIDSIDAVNRVTTLARDVVETRQRFAEQRHTLEPIEPSPGRLYDVRGQFAKSMVYDNPVGPRRYRIIDPNSVPARTLAYVEVPEGKDFDPDLYLGRFVGVRATARRLQQGVVRPLPIFMLGEISMLDQRDVLVQAPAGDLSRGVPGEGLEDEAAPPGTQEAGPGTKEGAQTPAPAESASKEEPAGK